MRSQYTAIMEQLVERLASSAAYEGTLEGCSEDEIDEIRETQGVKRLPRMYREFLLHMGRHTGGLEGYLGFEITYPGVCEFKRMSFDLLRQPDIFVMTHIADGDCAFYFHIDEDDPIVYWVGYDRRPEFVEFNVLETKDCGSLSNWLIDVVGDFIGDPQLPPNPIDKEE
ncbi:MAG: hypothetical protein ABI690_34030 [Chloroflexota bacterium]